jgi:co-chaperonin GroES (HSP10)|tara:strand:- start:3234 stop:3722 length:489 start_codon:yes stop_codon:yes gene_type:complete
MTKTLYVPESVLDSRKKQKRQKEGTIDTLVGAYVPSQDRVLDPALLSKKLKERLPMPTGWRLLVMPYKGKATTGGGIHIPDAVRDREALATVVAYVLKIGPLAYQDPNKFGPNPESWVREGDWVCIGRYAGARFKIEGGEVRIINDDEVIATILDPEDIQHV